MDNSDSNGITKEKKIKSILKKQILKDIKTMNINDGIMMLIEFFLIF